VLAYNDAFRKMQEEVFAKLNAEADKHQAAFKTLYDRVIELEGPHRN